MGFQRGGWINDVKGLGILLITLHNFAFFKTQSLNHDIAGPTPRVNTGPIPNVNDDNPSEKNGD